MTFVTFSWFIRNVLHLTHTRRIVQLLGINIFTEDDGEVSLVGLYRVLSETTIWY